MTDSKKEEYALVLSSLLHDIGKIGQRYQRNKTHASIGSEMVNEIHEIPEEIRTLVSELVSYHHTEKGSDYEFASILSILREADQRSAGHDRDDKDPADVSPKDLSLRSIYGYLDRDGPESSTEKGQTYLPLSSLDEMVTRVSALGGERLIGEVSIFSRIQSGN